MVGTSVRGSSSTMRGGGGGASSMSREAEGVAEAVEGESDVCEELEEEVGVSMGEEDSLEEEGLLAMVEEDSKVTLVEVLTAWEVVGEDGRGVEVGRVGSGSRGSTEVAVGSAVMLTDSVVIVCSTSAVFGASSSSCGGVVGSEGGGAEREDGDGLTSSGKAVAI
jgi:hypothetical protein